jgi:adenosylcobyric acid synthase
VVRQVSAVCAHEQWTAYEIHMGVTHATALVEVLQTVIDDGGSRPEGMRLGNVWGTYLHGWFESAALRQKIAAAAGLRAHTAHAVSWAQQRRELYAAMGEYLATSVNLEPIKRYLGL